MVGSTQEQQKLEASATGVGQKNQLPTTGMMGVKGLPAVEVY